jgi:S-DNA-T family DNA segregation ATPase FtsK/SpoIIIE
VARKQQQKNILKYEVTGLAMLTASALALGRLGLVGQIFAVASIYLAGSWYFLIPILVGYAALYMMIRRTKFPWDSRHVGLLIILLCFLAFMEMDFYGKTYESIPLYKAQFNALSDLRQYIFQPTGSAPPRAGGGFLGYGVFAILHALFNTPGTSEVGPRLVITAGCLIGIALALQTSLVNLVKRGTGWTEGLMGSLWQSVRSHVNVLFRSDKDTDDQVEQIPPGKSRRKKPELIVDGEVYEDDDAVQGSKAVRPQAKFEAPVIHDFTHRAGPLREETTDAAGTATAEPPLEQMGNQLVMRFPDAPLKKPTTPPQREHAPEGDYEVGTIVHDENFRLPPISLFTLPPNSGKNFSQRGAQANAQKLESTLQSFGVQARVLEISRGPTVTRYELQPAAGVKVSRIVGLTDDIALALAARDIRMEAPVPGKSVIGIEVPNEEVAIVSLREVLASPEFQKTNAHLALALGRDISGAPIVGDLQKMPHLLVAGATGAGKSVCINGIVASIMMRHKPHEVKLMMIDPKMVELSVYNGIPHLLAPVVTDSRKAAFALKKVVQEMENRYQLMAERGARDIGRYNQLLRDEGLEPLPFIVVIVDELADLMMVAPGDVEDAICRIAQMARAAGIHLIVATQRPSVDVITGLIKANIPSRIAFAVSSMHDSRTILDGPGAEKLLGRGDMLYMPVGASKAVRVQGAFVSEGEIERLVKFVKEQQHAVYTVDLNHGGEEETTEDSAGADLDALFADAVDLVVDLGQASASMLQRRFRIGYSRASRIVDQMEQSGIVGPFEGSKPREVMISKEQWLQAKSSFVRTQE